MKELRKAARSNGGTETPGKNLFGSSRLFLFVQCYGRFPFCLCDQRHLSKGLVLNDLFQKTLGGIIAEWDDFNKFIFFLGSIILAYQLGGAGPPSPSPPPAPFR